MGKGFKFSESALRRIGRGTLRTEADFRNLPAPTPPLRIDNPIQFYQLADPMQQDPPDDGGDDDDSQEPRDDGGDDGGNPMYRANANPFDYDPTNDDGEADQNTTVVVCDITGYFGCLPTNSVVACRSFGTCNSDDSDVYSGPQVQILAGNVPTSGLFELDEDLNQGNSANAHAVVCSQIKKTLYDLSLPTNTKIASGTQVWGTKDQFDLADAEDDGGYDKDGKWYAGVLKCSDIVDQDSNTDDGGD
jgi:hypothetical protein